MNYDKKILTISLTRGIEMFSASILVILLPIYISSDQIITDYFTQKSIYGFDITEEFIIGIALSMSIFISAILTPYFGRFSDKIKRRKIFIIIGLLILLISTPAYFYIESYYAILGLRIIQGISGALIAPVALAMVNEYAKINKGESFGHYNTIRLSGFALGPLIAGFIISNGPYNLFNISISGIDTAFYSIILFISVTLILFFLIVEEPRYENKAANNVSIKDVISTKNFKIVLIFAFATFWLSASINMFATLEHEINSKFNQSTTWFGLQFSAALLANIISQTPIGKAVDKYNKKPFIVIGFIILIPAVTLQGFASTPIQMTLLRVFQGLSVALVYIPSLTYIGEIANQNNSGFYLSFMSASFSLGLAIGPVASGILFSLGGFKLPFISAGVFSLIGLIIIVILTPKK